MSELRYALKRALEADQLLPGEGEDGRSALELLEALGPSTIAAELGSTRPVASLVLRIATTIASIDRAELEALLHSLLDVSPDAVDKGGDAGRHAAWMLAHVAEAPTSAEARDLATVVRSSHLSASRGQVVSRGEWADLRRSALSLTDKADNELERLAGSLIEALSWSMETSQTTLCEALPALIGVQMRGASRSCGLTDEHRTQIGAAIASLSTSTDAVGVEIEARFASAYPELDSIRRRAAEAEAVAANEVLLELSRRLRNSEAELRSE